MQSCILLLAAGAVALILYLMEKTKRYSVKGVLLKSVASALFILLALCAWYGGAGEGKPLPFGMFVLPGLLLGLLGDIWLDLKYVFPQNDEAFTRLGFGVFALGHVFYILGLNLQFPTPGRPLYAVAPLVLGALLGLGNALLLEKPMKLRYGKMKGIVAGYGFLLFSMVLTAGSLALAHGWREPALNLFFAGGVLFALSDLVLSGTYFGEGKERPVDFILNYVTYYGGQYLIAFSLYFLK